MLANDIFYLVGSALMKTSILLFYRRLESNVSPLFRRLTWAALAYVTLSAIIFVVVALNACHPFDAYWRQFEYQYIAEGHNFHCLDEGHFAFAAATVGASQDVLATTLPAVLYWNLRIERHQKLAIAAILGVGYLVCIISIFRIYAFYRLFWLSYDLTWEGWNVYLLTLLELLIAAMCTSVPAMNILIGKYIWKKGGDDGVSGLPPPGGFGTRSLGSGSAMGSVSQAAFVVSKTPSAPHNEERESASLGLVFLAAMGAPGLWLMSKLSKNRGTRSGRRSNLSRSETPATLPSFRGEKLDLAVPRTQHMSQSLSSASMKS